MAPLDKQKVRELRANGIDHVYLGGPMTGYPQFNFPAFFMAAEVLRRAGLTVTSPAELDDPATRRASLASLDGAPGSGTANGETWEDFLARDIVLLASDAIDGGIFLPGWTRSRGANFEAAILKSLAKPVLRYPTLNPVRHQPRLPYQQSEED